jgi:hypothetical protein
MSPLRYFHTITWNSYWYSDPLDYQNPYHPWKHFNIDVAYETVKFSLEPGKGEIWPLKAKFINIRKHSITNFIRRIVVILPRCNITQKIRYIWSITHFYIIIYCSPSNKMLTWLFIWFIVTVAFPSIVYEPPDIVIGFVSVTFSIFTT